MRISENRSGLTPSGRQFLLYRYLLEHSSKDRVVKPAELIDLLAGHSIRVSINTLYNDLEVLKAAETFNLDIEYDFSKKGYRVNNPPFEPSEVRLLIDSVQSSQFITQRKADEICAKVSKLTDVYTAAHLRRQSFVENRIHSMNESVVKYADRLFEAIGADCKIGFKFFHYSRDGKKEYSRGGKLYIVSPFAMIWRGGFYYLYAFVDGENRFRYFRIDRMDNITKPLPETRAGKEKYLAKELTNRTVKNFGVNEGKEERVKLLFNTGLVDAVRDAFGKDVLMIPADETHFSVTVDVHLNMAFYAWLFSFARGVKIIGPDSVKEKMREYANNIAEMYKEDGEM